MNADYTMTEIKAAAKNAGVKITKSTSTVNGKAAYKIEGQNGLFSKSGLIRFFFS